MSKIVLDEGVPEPLAEHLPGHLFQSVRQLGLKGVKNGRLLDAIQACEFYAFITDDFITDACITNDKRMQAEQTLPFRPFAILTLSACNWPTIKPNVDNIASALDEAKPGTICTIDCGVFVPRRFRAH